MEVSISKHPLGWQVRTIHCYYKNGEDVMETRTITFPTLDLAIAELRSKLA